jgi:hypothetical protein
MRGQTDRLACAVCPPASALDFPPTRGKTMETTELWPVALNHSTAVDVPVVRVPLVTEPPCVPSRQAEPVGAGALS